MTERIIEIAEETARALSHASYRESCYQSVLMYKLKQAGYKVQAECGVVYKLPDGFQFGHGRLDLVVEDTTTDEVFIIELKANVRVNPRRDLGQLARYQIHWPVTAVGLLFYYQGWDKNILHFRLDPC